MNLILCIRNCVRTFPNGAKSPIAWLAAGFASLTACGCSFGDTSEAAATAGRKKGGRPPALVRVAEIESRIIHPRVIVVGSVIPRRTSRVASGANGLVEKFHVEEGEFVSKGEILAVLRMKTADLGIAEAKAVLREREQQLDELEAGSRDEDIAEAKAKMLAVEAMMKNMSSKHKRAQQLFQQNAANRSDLDDAVEKSEGARQAFLAAEATYQRVVAGPRKEEIGRVRARFEAQQEQVKYLEAEKQKRITQAPFDGYVVKEQTYVGQWLSKGDLVATLAILKEVDVVVNVDQWDLHHVRIGQIADVTVNGSTQLHWKGKIVQLVPRSDWKSGSRGFPVKVRLQNRFDSVEGRKVPVLKEGMMAEVTFEGEPVDAVVVPKDALVRTSRGTIMYIFIPGEDDQNQGTVRQVSVELGISDGSFIQAKAEGIGSGMLVVTEGAERLRPFQNVKLAVEEKGENGERGASTP